MKAHMSLTKPAVRETELLASSRIFPEAENSHTEVANAESNSKEKQ
jgi:hypothetical protein